MHGKISLSRNELSYINTPSRCDFHTSLIKKLQPGPAFRLKTLKQFGAETNLPSQPREIFLMKRGMKNIPINVSLYKK